MEKFLEMPVAKVPVSKSLREKDKMEDCSEYIEKCCKRVGETEYFKSRGLSKETIEKFWMGYDSEKKLVTIPYNPGSKGYIHRILFDGNSKYVKHGVNEIFNVKALYCHEIVFVTEGQFDAMSFEEIRYPAIGIGGTNEVGKLVELLKKPEIVTKKLIIALDNDAAGVKATARFLDAIADVKCEYLIWNGLYGKYKDANEFLINDREKFVMRCCELYEKCK